MDPEYVTEANELAKAKEQSFSISFREGYRLGLQRAQGLLRREVMPISGSNSNQEIMSSPAPKRTKAQAPLNLQPVQPVYRGLARRPTNSAQIQPETQFASHAFTFGEGPQAVNTQPTASAFGMPSTPQPSNATRASNA